MAVAVCIFKWFDWHSRTLQSAHRCRRREQIEVRFFKRFWSIQYRITIPGINNNESTDDGALVLLPKVSRGTQPAHLEVPGAEPAFLNEYSLCGLRRLLQNVPAMTETEAKQITEVLNERNELARRYTVRDIAKHADTFEI